MMSLAEPLTPSGQQETTRAISVSMYSEGGQVILDDHGPTIWVKGHCNTKYTREDVRDMDDNRYYNKEHSAYRTAEYWK
jgi:hypothetical protein